MQKAIDNNLSQCYDYPKGVWYLRQRSHCDKIRDGYFFTRKEA